MGLTRVSSSPSPVTLAEQRAHLRLDAGDTGEDALVQAYLDAATDYIERETNLTLAPFPEDDADPLRLPNPPLTDVVSVVYTGPDGVAHTLPAGDYAVDENSMPGRIVLRAGKRWPATADRPGCVEVTFLAGYVDSQLPPTLSAAIRLLAAQLFEQREAAHDRTITEVPFALRAIINQHKLQGVP